MVALHTINENHLMTSQALTTKLAAQALAIALFKAYAAHRVAQSAQ